MQKYDLRKVLFGLALGLPAQAMAEETWFDYSMNTGQINMKLSEAQVDALVSKNIPRCRNVLVAGPVAADFDDALLMTQLNGRTGVFKNPSQEILREFNAKMKSGIKCRSNYPQGLRCTGIGYLDPIIGEVVRVNRSKYKRYGDLTEFYVPVMIRWPGSNDFLMLHAEKRNTRCSGNPEGPGVATGLPGVDNDQFIFW